MNTVPLAFAEAASMIARGDPRLLEIIWLSIRVSLTSVTLSPRCSRCPPARRSRSRTSRAAGATIVVLNALLGLPAVVVGLAVYLLLSRAGPLGAFGILFTPAAMVVAQAVLVFPLLAALTRQLVADAWSESREQLQSLGAGTGASALALLFDLRFTLVTVVLAGFGRAIAEVGAVMIVGGNIDGVTRVMTTAIALETSKGDLPLALGLGHRAAGAGAGAERSSRTWSRKARSDAMADTPPAAARAGATSSFVARRPRHPRPHQPDARDAGRAA